jgi:hypothetical protein
MVDAVWGEGDNLLRRVLCGATAATLALAPVIADASCFTEAEWKAAHVKVLQLDLQVAALECANVQGASYTNEYNSFIGRFNDRLAAEGKVLRAHFQRVYRGASEKELDIFVTKVANYASDRSMQDMSFCANSASVFKDALAIETPQLEDAALLHVVDHSQIGEVCEAAPAPKKAKKVKTAAK